MGRKRKSRDYLNMDIPFKELAKPRTKEERFLYNDRKCMQWERDCPDGFGSDEFDEDFSEELGVLDIFADDEDDKKESGIA